MNYKDSPIGVTGKYTMQCLSREGQLRWQEGLPVGFSNVVTQAGKQFMFDAVFRTGCVASNSYLGLVSGGSPVYSASDTMSLHSGWEEYGQYLSGNSVVERPLVTFSPAESSGDTPANVTRAIGNSSGILITGSGEVSGCFLVVGENAEATIGSTTGVLYSVGGFSASRPVVAGDVLAITYTTTAQS